MKWETIKRSVAAELHHRLDLMVITGSGEPHLELVKLIRDLNDGLPIPAKIQKLLDAHHTLGRALIKAAHDEVDRIVPAWDIRSAGRLRQIAPEAFPKGMRSGRMNADLDEKGDWTLHPDKGVAA